LQRRSSNAGGEHHSQTLGRNFAQWECNCMLRGNGGTWRARSNAGFFCFGTLFCTRTATERSLDFDGKRTCERFVGWSGWKSAPGPRRHVPGKLGVAMSRVVWARPRLFSWRPDMSLPLALCHVRCGGSRSQGDNAYPCVLHAEIYMQM
jgi:hypothetical protein